MLSTHAFSTRAIKSAKGIGATKGFSLIELMVAIVIMTVLLSLAVPEFRNWMQSTRVRTIAENYLAGLQLARAEAIKSNQSAKITLKDRGAWEIKDASDTVLQTRPPGEGDTNVATTISLPGGSTLPYDVVFNGLGRLTTPAASMQLDFSSPTIGACLGGGGPIRCLRINIQVGGAIRLCDPSRSAGDPQAC